MKICHYKTLLSYHLYLYISPFIRTYSVNEFGANICEYPGNTCPIVKYFQYPGGGGGVELCCKTNSNCNYDPIKNYCHPEYKRCVDGSYFGCSVKKGPIFDKCL